MHSQRGSTGLDRAVVATVVAIDSGRRCTLGSLFATRPGRSEHEGQRLCGSTGSVGARRAAIARVDRVGRSTKGSDCAGRPGRSVHMVLASRRSTGVGWCWVCSVRASRPGWGGAGCARFVRVDRGAWCTTSNFRGHRPGCRGARLATFVAIDRGAWCTTSNFRGHLVARAVQGVHRGGGSTGSGRGRGASRVVVDRGAERTVCTCRA